MESKKINQLATAMSPSSTDLTIIGDPISGVSKKATLQQISSLFGSAVSFYTNLAAFPATGTVDTLYCAKDTYKLYLWSGSAYVQTFPSQSLLDTYQLKSEKGASNGYASLDSSGKVPISQLPSSIMEYKGMWNASTNTPTLANGTGDTGDVYICNAAGTVNFGAGAITFAVGDYVVYSGTIWQRSSGAVGTVTSVAVTESGDALTITGSPVTTSGTINIGFAGTSAQYVAGDGSLVTFPTVVTQAQNLVTEVYNETGATLTKGTVVYINGGHGNLPTITKAIATSDATSAQTYGVVRTDITNNNNGYVTVIGNLDNIDTQAYAAGTQLYLSSTTAGAWTSVKQYAPAHLVYVGIVTRSHPTQGVIEIKIQNGFELDELHNVSAQTPSNNQGLFYNSSNSLWENKSIATALGYTPANDSLVVKLAGTQTITGDKNFSGALISSNGYGITLDGGGTYGGMINFKSSSNTTARGYGYSSIGVIDTTKFLFYSPIDLPTNSKRFYFELSGLTTNVERTYTMPDASGTLALTSDIPSLTGYITGTGTSGYIPYFNGTSSVTGTSNLFWDNTNKFLGIGTNAPSAGVTSYSTTAATQFKAAGTAPAFTFSNTLTSPTYGCVFGLATANGHFVTGTAAGDMAIANQSTTAGAIVFGTGTTEKMRMTSAGTFSIGNTNSTYTLDVSGTGRFTGNLRIDKATPLLVLNDTSGSGAQIGSFSNNLNLIDNATGTKGLIISLSTGAATFSSSVGVGGTSAGNFSGVSFTGPFLDVAGVMQIKGTSANGVAIIQLGGDTYRKATIETSIGTADPYIAFGTSSSGSSSSGTERMRITSGGWLKVSDTGSYWTAQSYHEINTSNNNNSLLIRNTNSTPYGLWISFTGGSPNTTNNEFIYASDTIQSKFIVWSNGSVVNRTGSYGTISDVKFKENIVDATPKLEDLMQLKVRNFNMIGDEAKQIGFIAQEFEEVFPSMIDTSIDKESGDEYKSIKTSVLVPMLVKAVQELKLEIDELKNK